MDLVGDDTVAYFLNASRIGLFDIVSGGGFNVLAFEIELDGKKTDREFGLLSSW